MDIVREQVTEHQFQNTITPTVLGFYHGNPAKRGGVARAENDISFDTSAYPAANISHSPTNSDASFETPNISWRCRIEKRTHSRPRRDIPAINSIVAPEANRTN